MKNYMKLEIKSLGENEAFARGAVSAFALSLNPSLSELSYIKTAVSEAVTNCIVHAYKKDKDNKILIECETECKGACGILHIRITDFGCGIKDTEQALTPFFTTLSDDERSGMGFTIMQTFMDEFALKSTLGKGTEVYMKKVVGITENETVRDGVNA
jgi:stage II sporulation protein AB (anti-sigma F factor)